MAAQLLTLMIPCEGLEQVFQRCPGGRGGAIPGCWTARDTASWMMRRTFDLKLADMVLKAGIRRLEKGFREDQDEYDK